MSVWTTCLRLSRGSCGCEVDGGLCGLKVSVERV